MDIYWIDRATKLQREIALAAQFQEIAFSKRDGCSDQITVRAGGAAQTLHEILEPIQILLREMSDGGAFNAVAVDAEEGTTLMRFHPVIHPGWLEGLIESR